MLLHCRTAPDSARLTFLPSAIKTMRVHFKCFGYLPVPQGATGYAGVAGAPENVFSERGLTSLLALLIGTSALVACKLWWIWRC